MSKETKFEWNDKAAVELAEYVSTHTKGIVASVTGDYTQLINDFKQSKGKELHKGSEEDIELKKCQDSPYYFATKYLTVNGRPFRTMMNERQFNEIFFHLDEPPPETLTNTVTDNSDVVCLSLNDLKELDHAGNGEVIMLTSKKILERINQKLKQ